jgi:hypothetical protein
LNLPPSVDAPRFRSRLVTTLVTGLENCTGSRLLYAHQLVLPSPLPHHRRLRQRDHED